MKPNEIIAAAIAQLRMCTVSGDDAELMMRTGLAKYQEKAAPWRTYRVEVDPTPSEESIGIDYPAWARSFYAVSDKTSNYILSYDDVDAKKVIIDRDEEDPVFPLELVFFLEVKDLPLDEEIPREVSTSVLVDWMVASLEVPNERRFGDLGAVLDVDFHQDDHGSTVDRRKSIEEEMAACYATLPMLNVVT